MAANLSMIPASQIRSSKQCPNDPISKRQTKTLDIPDFGNRQSKFVSVLNI
jgi:hypothetical protein